MDMKPWRSYGGSCGSEEARAAAGDRVFEIKIQRIDGSSQLVEVRPEMTGLQLKELIAQKLSISTDQRLICRGRAIKDDDMLGTHITDSGQIVHMVQRPPAAPPTVNAPNVPNVPSAMPMMPGMSGGIPGMSMTGMTGMPFPSQSQVVHIAVADFLPGMPPVPPPTGPGLGPGVGPGAPGPPGSSFTLNPQAERFTPQAERQTWSKSAPMSPPQSHPPMQGQPMQGVPVMPSFPLPPVPPPPMVTLPGPVGPMTMPPPQFPPPPMPVFLQQGVGLAQVIPQMLGAAEPAVPPPPPTLRHDGRAGALPWRDLRRLHSHLSLALGRTSGFRAPPEGLTPQAELTSFLNQLHAATSQLGVAVSDMQSSVEHQEQRSRQRLQFTMVLASAGRVFRALSTNLMVQNAQDAESGATGVSLELRGEPAGATGLGSTVQDSSNEALVEAESHGVQPLELFPHCWHQTMPGPCPAHLTRPYVSAFLQEVTTFLQQTDFAATPGATDRYPHLSLLLRG